MNAATASTDARDAYNRILLADPGSLDVTLSPGAVTGDISPLRGATWFGNGPTRLSLGGRTIHPFDGHGYVRTLRFGMDGQVRLRAEPVRTKVWEAESAAGRVVEVGLATRPSDSPLATAFAPWGRNVANTCVLPWAGGLLALWEGGNPHRLDPETLETLGTERFHGAVEPREIVLAHTRVCPRTGHLITLSPRIGGPRTGFVARAIDASGREVSRSRAEVPGFSVIHDFVITERYVVVLVNSMEASLTRLVASRMGFGSLIEAVRMNDRPARVVLIPRDGSAPSVHALPRALLSVHHVNAWEEEDRVVLVTCGLEAFTFGAEFGYQGPHRPLEVDEGGAARQRLSRFDVGPDGVRERVLTSLAVDFPMVRADRVGQRVRTAFFVVARSDDSPLPLAQLARVDLETGEHAVYRPASGMIGEPLLLPVGDGDADVLVLAMHYRPGATSLLVLDGRDLGRGPVAEVTMPTALPYGFHGFLAPAGSA